MACMIVNELAKFINGKVVTGDGEHSVAKAFASDLMSDVLTMDEEDLVLITGLCTQQVIRTAEMSDISTVIFARGKTITQDIIDLAKKHEITLISSDLSVFKLCGILWGKLDSVY
ncbi:MAG: hypothetical protein JXR64_03435 [Spirochaetales bacterium]|nr:hypothetical protein [Spirochaetales bacterium]